MVNIAVCDDDIQFAADLENRILSYGKQKAVSLDTEVFSDGDSILLAILNGGQYDLVYMDIEMGNRNGISTVREIKKISPETMVIYVTFHEVYFTQMFETEPFRYLGKPLEEESFNRYLEDALKRIRERLCYYTYTTGHSTCRVPVRDIFYFESRRRKVILHGKDGTDIFYGRLGEIQKELEKGGRPFIRIHQSYLVNPYEINRYYPDRVEMVGKMLLPISESRQREVKEKFHSFLREL